MKIALSILNYMLPETVIYRGSAHSADSIKCVLLYRRGINCISNTLYICDAGELQGEYDETLSGAVFVPVGADGERCAQLARELDCVCLGFPTDLDLVQIHTRIQQAIVRFEDWETLLDATVYRCTNVQELYKKAEIMLHDPILAWNPAFHMVACANTDLIDPENMPPLMRNFIKGGGWAGKDVDIMIKKHDYLTMPVRYMDVRLLSPPNMMNCYSCVRNFSLSGKIVLTSGAYYLDGEKPHDGKIELLRAFFSRVLRYLELNSSTYTGSRKIYERFILSLIEGKLNNEADISDSLCYLNFPYRSSFEVIVVGCNKNAQSMSLGLIRNYCKNYFKHAKFIEYRSHLVGINNRQWDTQSDIDRRREIFSNTDTRADFSLGISCVYNCLIDTEKAFNQAKTALQYGRLMNRGGQYYTYSDYYIYYVLHQLNGKESSPSASPDAAYIYKLRESDRNKAGVENERLLRTYILSGRNTSVTAEEMSLHRNSVLYRIKQIETMLGIDLNDPDAVFHITLGIKSVSLSDALEREKATEKIDEGF